MPKTGAAARSPKISERGPHPAKVLQRRAPHAARVGSYSIQRMELSHGHRGPSVQPQVRYSLSCVPESFQPGVHVTDDGRLFLQCSKVLYQAKVERDWGEAALIQLIDTTRLGRNSSGRYNLLKSAEFVLDTRPGSAPGTTTYGPIQDWVDQHSGCLVLQPNEYNDQPAQQVDDTLNQVKVREMFQVYLVYRQDSSAAWSPLACAEWGWSGHAERSNLGWALHGGQVWASPAQPCQVLPTWQRHVRQVPWESNQTLFALQQKYGFPLL